MFARARAPEMSRAGLAPLGAEPMSKEAIDDVRRAFESIPRKAKPPEAKLARAGLPPLGAEALSKEAVESIPRKVEPAPRLVWAAGLREPVQAALAPPDARAAQAAIRGPRVPFDSVAHIDVNPPFVYVGAPVRTETPAGLEAAVRDMYEIYQLPRRWTLEAWRALGGEEPEWDLVRPRGAASGPGMFYRSEIHAEQAVERFLRIAGGVLDAFDAFRVARRPAVEVGEWTTASPLSDSLAHANSERIWFRRSVVVGAPDDLVRDLFLHELAHVIAKRCGLDNGSEHGPIWAGVARALGGSGTRTFEDQAAAAYHFESHVYHRLMFRCDADPARPHVFARSARHLMRHESVPGRPRCALHPDADRGPAPVPNPDWPYMPRFAVFDCGGACEKRAAAPDRVVAPCGTRKVYLLGERAIPLDRTCAGGAPLALNERLSSATTADVAAVNAYLLRYRGRAWPYPAETRLALDPASHAVGSVRERCYEFRCPKRCRFLLPESLLEQRALLAQRCVCEAHGEELAFFPDARRHEPPRILVYACDAAEGPECARAAALGSRFLDLELGDRAALARETHAHRDGTTHGMRIRCVHTKDGTLEGDAARAAVLDANLVVAAHDPAGA